MASIKIHTLYQAFDPFTQIKALHKEITKEFLTFKLKDK